MAWLTAGGSSSFSSFSGGQNSEDRMMADRANAGCSSSLRRDSSSRMLLLILRESAMS